MEFRVLGPLEVVTRGVDITPTAPMPRRVLATLLVNYGQVVPISTLIEELWPDEPPRLARKTVQTYLHQLRKAFAAAPGIGDRALLETRNEGYRIHVEPGELDLTLFREEVRKGRARLAAGDPEAAVRLLGAGLDHWRGDALADLQRGPVLAGQAAWLEDLRLSALEQRIEAELRLGRHRELVGELTVLTGRHPGHEQFCAQLMLAAYRAGRREDALAAYSRLRRTSVERSGLEPSERLKRLHQAVLAEAPTLLAPVQQPAARAAAVVRPAELPSLDPDFTGRTTELESLLSALAPEREHAGARTALLTGGVGIGKTALAVHAAHSLRERFPDGQLFAALHTAQEQPLPAVQVLHAFLRTFGAANLPSSVDESARLFRSLTTDLRVLVVLDDAASSSQVAPLLPGGSGCATLITSRDNLAGLPGAGNPVRLGPLVTAEAVALLARRAGPARVGDQPQAVEDLVALCSHLPLAIKAVAERLAADPALSPAVLAARLREEDARLAEMYIGRPDMRTRLSGAYRRLEPSSRDALRRLARTGPAGAVPETVPELLGLAPWRARQLVDELVGAHLVETVPVGGDEPSRLRVPDLIRLSEPAEPVCRTGRPARPGHARLPRQAGARHWPATTHQRPVRHTRHS